MQDNELFSYSLGVVSLYPDVGSLIDFVPLLQVYDFKKPGPPPPPTP